MTTATDTDTAVKPVNPAVAAKAIKAAKSVKAPKAAKAPKAKPVKPVDLAADGRPMPRKGTKAAKLLAMLTRKDGATFGEMKKATNWKEMRGTALVLCRRIGKTLVANVDPDGNKATRYVAG